MKLLPLFLDLDQVPVLVIGRGDAMERRVAALRTVGARVYLVAPTAVAGRRREGVIELGERLPPNWAGELRPRLVVLAGAAPDTADAVSEVARDHGIWVNAVDDPQRCSAVWPAVVDRAPIRVAIGSDGSAPVLVRRIRERIEALLPSSLGALAQLAGSMRARVAARYLSLVDRRRFWEWALADWRFTPATARRWEQRLAGTVPGAGRVDLVGAGPGDPDLLTLRALQVLQRADVILHDRLVDPRILDRARRDARLVAVGKAATGDSASQSDINALMLELAATGHHVCRLKGGDPLVFGRAGEEIQALRSAGIEHAVVPGITAALAAAAGAALPLTHRDQAHALVLAAGHGQDHRALAELAALAGPARTLAIYMGVGELPRICRALAERLPAATPVCAVENASRDDQRVLTSTLATLLSDARAFALRPPAMLLIGPTAAQAAAATIGAREVA